MVDLPHKVEESIIAVNLTVVLVPPSPGWQPGVVEKKIWNWG